MFDIQDFLISFPCYVACSLEHEVLVESFEGKTAFVVLTDSDLVDRLIDEQLDVDGARFNGEVIQCDSRGELLAAVMVASYMRSDVHFIAVDPVRHKPASLATFRGLVEKLIE